MADIELVIKIPEELYNYTQTERYDEHLDRRFDWQIRFAVKDSTPLPKGHGKLIDADNLKENVCKWLKPSVPDESMLVDIAEVGADVCKEIEEQPTIIDADKE